MTGWFIYRCGKGVLLVPAPRCVGPECQGGSKGDFRNLGFSGDIAAGSDGTFQGARRASALFAASGAEVAGATAALGDLRDQGAISSHYANAARRAVEKDPDKYIPIIAPGVRRELLGQTIGSYVLGIEAKGVSGADVGPNVADGCRCTPRPFDARDPISGWGIYYTSKGVLLTPTEKCIAGGGSPPGWFAQTWRNTLALFRAAPQNDISQSPELPPVVAPPTTTAPTPEPAQTPCEPDNIIGRDDGMFGTGWWIVKGPPGRTGLVPNPNTCPP